MKILTKTLCAASFFLFISYGHAEQKSCYESKFVTRVLDQHTVLTNQAVNRTLVHGGGRVIGITMNHQASENAFIADILTITAELTYPDLTKENVTVQQSCSSPYQDKCVIPADFCKN